MTKLFFDTEFTGLRKNTQLISIGIVSDCGKTFYAEFTDFNWEDIDEWLQEHVIDNTFYLKNYSATNKPVACGDFPINYCRTPNNKNTYMLSHTDFIRDRLIDWLNQFADIEMISDTLAYDWVLFVDLFGGSAFDIPKHIYYIPTDLATLLLMYAGDADICRVDYAEAFIRQKEMDSSLAVPHNALYDAFIIRACYERVMKLREVTNRVLASNPCNALIIKRVMQTDTGDFG